MSGELDINDIAAKFAVQIIEQSSASVSGTIKRHIDRFKLKLTAGINEYARETATRVSLVRTLVADDPVSLLEIYVPSSFQHRGRDISEEAALSNMETSRRCLIVGTAGSGKSMFVRHLFLRRVSEGKRLPVLLDLRTVNDSSDPLFTVLYSQINRIVPEFDISLFREMMEKDKIEFLLDGFDEINSERRRDIARQLGALLSEFPRLRATMTTRPSDMDLSWEGLHTFKVLPMPKAATLMLLRQLSYDEETKRNFIDRVDSEWYDKYTDLLSNPLLTTMMLMTYRQFAEMPSKIHIFYQLAFETLYRRHDASKWGQFVRKMHTSLSIDEFQQAFSHFCALSYAQERFAFLEVPLISSLKDSISYAGLNADAGRLKDDLVESLCLLIRDGVEYRFVHRTFQEYFAATFAIGLEPHIMKAALDAALGRVVTDSVIPMAHQMSPGAVEAAWVKPTLDWLRDIFESSDDGLSRHFDEVGVLGGEPVASVGDHEVWTRLAALQKIFAEEPFEGGRYVSLDHAALERFRAELKKKGPSRTYIYEGGGRALLSALDDIVELPDFLLEVDKAPQTLNSATLWGNPRAVVLDQIGRWSKSVDERMARRAKSASELFLSLTKR